MYTVAACPISITNYPVRGSDHHGHHQEHDCYLSCVKWKCKRMRKCVSECYSDHRQSSEDCASENAMLRESKPTTAKSVMPTFTAAGNVLAATLSLAATVAFVVAVL